MHDFHVIQITEKLPPSLHGIGDYAFKLACQLKQKYDITGSFIIFDGIQEQYDLNVFPVYSLSKFNSNLSDTLLQVIQKNNQNTKNIVILHYDRGFYDTYINKEGFEKYYFSKHLPRFIDSFKAKFDGAKLIIVFHEFFSPVIERRRDYILRPMQNFLMKEVIKSADAAICSNSVVERQLKSLVPDVNIFRCPVFSNVGEPINLSNKEESSWVIFGSTDNLRKTLQKFIVQLPIIRSSQPIHTVNIIGGKIDTNILNFVNELKGYIPIVNYLPSISNQEVSHIFSISKFCYMYYFTKNLLADSALIFKSGVFATACSYGAIPVFGNLGMEHTIGVFDHPGFICIKNDQFNFPNPHKLDELSNQIFGWYQEYAHSSIATDRFFSAIENVLNYS